MRHCCIAPSFPNFSKNAHLKAKIRQHPFLSRSVEYENIPVSIFDTHAGRPHVRHSSESPHRNYYFLRGN